jgi:predicted HAD superfamily Cof-like phosphohydrolase
MTDLWNDVRRFNQAAGTRMRALPGWVPDDELNLALALIAEELGELDKALDERDIIETADGIADSLFVLAGLALRLGVARGYITDIITGMSHSPLMTMAGLAGFATVTDDEIDSMRGDLVDSHARILAAVDDRNLVQLDPAIHHAMYGTAGIGLVLCLPMHAVWQEVTDSNMSKLVDGKLVRREDGKVLKGPTFKAPDIAGVLAAHGLRDVA